MQMNRSNGRKRPNQDVVDNGAGSKYSRIEEIKPDQSTGPESITVTDFSTALDYFEPLPDEVLALIILMLPVRQWPNMERINHHFQRAVFAAWRKFRKGALTQFVDVKSMETKSAFERKAILSTLLTLLINRSPNLESLYFFEKFVKTLELRFLRQVIQFRNLRSIHFSHCLIQALHLAEFLSTSGSRGNLKDLHLVNSLRFAGSLTPEVANEKRQLNDEVLGIAVADIRNRPSLKLKRLWYYGNNVLSGSFLESLDVSELENLSMKGSQIRPNYLAQLLRRCTRLVSLDISTDYFRLINNVQGEYPSSMVNIDVVRSLGDLPSPNLQALFLNWSTVWLSDQEFRALGQALANLGRRCQVERMRITLFENNAMTQIVDNISGAFSTLTRLWLRIDGCGRSALIRLAERLTNLKELCFSSRQKTQSVQLDSSVLSAIGTHLRELIRLELARPAVQPDSVRALGQLPKLKKLSIGGHYIKNKTVMNICQSFGHRLETLELLDVTAVSDFGMANSVKKLVNIRRLFVTNSAITDITLRAIAASCPLLVELNLQNCSRVTKSGAQAVIDSCKSLTRLWVEWSPDGFVERD